MAIKVRAAGDKSAEVLIFDVIGADFFGEGVTAKRVKQDLDALGEVDDITVRINSPGGNVWDGLAIFNMLKEHPAEVHVQVEGLAASAASFIAMAGDLITMGEGSMMMIHNPATLAWGDGDALRKAADMVDKVEQQTIDIYSRRTGIDAKKIDDMLAAETWMTDAEAVELGFADERTAERAVPKPAASWDKLVALFKHPPESLKRLQIAAAVTPLSANAGATPKGGNMSTTAPASVQTTDIEKARQEAAEAAVKAETERRSGIKSAFTPFAEAHRALMDECLDDPKCSVDAARAKLLAKLGEGASPASGGSVVTVVDARDKFLAGATKALLVRSGIEKREEGNEFNGMPLWMLAGHALQLRGISPRGMSPDQVARKVLALSSSDFPELLANTAGKILRNAYGAFPQTWQRWCGVRSVSDFKQIKNIQMGAFNDLATIPEGGEYGFGAFTEEAEPNQAVTKGKGLRLTRQMIVNDDLGGFNRRAQMLGAAAARTVNSDAYSVINTNGNLSDSVALFHATHANLAGTAAVISTATLSAGKAAMRKQKDAGDREYLNIQPAYLLVPVAIEDDAKEVVSSTTKSGQNNSNQPNVLRNFVEVISDPKLDATSATAWYLVADPMVAELVQGVFLDGVQEPFIDDDVEFLTDSLLFKVRLDYGFAAVDFRAGYKNAGA